jgi:hypothetical protein
MYPLYLHPFWVRTVRSVLQQHNCTGTFTNPVWITHVDPAVVASLTIQKGIRTSETLLLPSLPDVLWGSPAAVILTLQSMDSIIRNTKFLLMIILFSCRMLNTTLRVLWRDKNQICDHLLNVITGGKLLNMGGRHHVHNLFRVLYCTGLLNRLSEKLRHVSSSPLFIVWRQSIEVLAVNRLVRHATYTVRYWRETFWPWPSQDAA